MAAVKRLLVLPAHRRSVHNGQTHLRIQLTLAISTSLISNNRLSRSEIWFLPKHENLTTCKKNIVEKRGNFFSFPQYFQYISNFKSPNTHINVVNRISFSSCRSTDISKYFRESLGNRDNESRLYMHQKHSYNKMALR